MSEQSRPGVKAVKLKEICIKESSSLRQRDLLAEGLFPVYGAAGIAGTLNEYQIDKQYVAVIKDGAGVGRVRLCDAKTSVLGTMQALVPRDSVMPGYLLHLVRSMNLGSGFTGSTIPHIYFRDYGERTVLLPSMDQQALIVERFRQVEGAIGILNMQLAVLDDLVKSRFFEMFGDTVYNSKSLPVRKLGELIGFMTSGSRGWAKYYTEDGDWFITIKNVKNCSISVKDIQCVDAPKSKEADRTKVKEGDVLISITADLGRTGVVTKEIAEHGAYINQHLACIRIKDPSIIPMYLSYFLESPGGINQFLRKNQNGVKAGLNFKNIQSLEVQIPAISQQIEFATFVAQVDKMKAVVQQSIDKLQMLYDSLAQEYFGGDRQ